MSKPRDGRDGRPGKDGRDGVDGQDGRDAYQVAKAHGFTGTAKDWLVSLLGINGQDAKWDWLRGKQGDRGQDGKDGANGKDGRNGRDGLTGAAGEKGSSGSDGLNGWSPLLAVVEDHERRVHQVVDWTGGEGKKPPVDFYLGKDGPVDRKEDATDIRGPAGKGLEQGGASNATLKKYILKLITENMTPTPFAGYLIANEDSDGDEDSDGFIYKYYGYVDTVDTTKWYILRVDDTIEAAAYLYANSGAANYTAAWSSRHSLAYMLPSGLTL